MRFTGVSLFSLLLLITGAQAQTRVQPGRDIEWPTCAIGQVYAPNGNQCFNNGGGTSYPALLVNSFPGSDFGNKLINCIASLSIAYGGICDGRSYTAGVGISQNIIISTPNVLIYLPCAQILTSYQLIVSPGIRNVRIEGCVYQGGTTANGLYGGTVWIYQGNGAAFWIGDLSADTKGFWMENLNINTLGAGSAAEAIHFYRTQEIRLDNLYLNGNQNTGQTGITLDGSDDYAGGTFIDVAMNGFGTGWYLTGNDSPAGSWANASTFIKTHIDCPTSGGSPIANTYGISIISGDGNTFIGGDIEGCSQAVELFSEATNNTFIGVRNENSTYQVYASAGSAYNSWITGGAMYTGQLVDAGTHNSFQDAFHVGINNLNGNIWRSQADTTITNHIYTGIGLGNVRGRQDEWTTDVPGSPGQYQNMWLWGPGDGTAGTQTWVLQDLLNGIIRVGVDLSTTAGDTNNTYFNSTGFGRVCINCSVGSGTGGLNVAQGGATPLSVMSVDRYGNTNITGNLGFVSGAVTNWKWTCSTLGTCKLQDLGSTYGTSPFISYSDASTEIDSQTSYPVVINNHAEAGTGGLIVYEGGANYNVPAFLISGIGTWSSADSGQVGSASGIGNLTLGNHLNQLATADYAGTCTMATASSCTITFQHSWASEPACSVTPQFQPSAYFWYTWATNVVNVHTSANQSGTFAVICVGNPN